MKGFPNEAERTGALNYNLRYHILSFIENYSMSRIMKYTVFKVRFLDVMMRYSVIKMNYTVFRLKVFDSNYLTFQFRS